MAFFYAELAPSGSETTLSSLLQTYNELALNRPDVLYTLIEPWIFDRYLSSLEKLQSLPEVP